MASIVLTAHAKINLFLKVLAKRTDGYHDLHTIFERVSLADSITITKIRRGIRVSSDVPITRDQKDNLAYKAAELLLGYKRASCGIDIYIKKNIPIAAGLGGGSSDAAAVLIGINRILGLRLPIRTLMKLGARLGSDVPFFIMDTPFALGRERGDRLRSMESEGSFWHLLIYPGFHLSTKEVYKAYDAGRRARVDTERLTSPKADVKIQLPLKLSMDFKATEAMMHNDLETAAISQKRVIGTILKRLATLLGKKVTVSGSGPSVFCLYSTGKEAERAKKTVLQRVPARERKDWQIYTMRTC